MVWCVWVQRNLSIRRRRKKNWTISRRLFPSMHVPSVSSFLFFFCHFSLFVLKCLVMLLCAFCAFILRCQLYHLFYACSIGIILFSTALLDVEHFYAIYLLVFSLSLFPYIRMYSSSFFCIFVTLTTFISIKS